MYLVNMFVIDVISKVKVKYVAISSADFSILVRKKTSRNNVRLGQT